MEPTNGELAIMLSGLTDKFDGFCERNEMDHEAVIAQTTKTNGRVTDLEKFKNTAFGVVIALNLLVVPIIVSFILEKL